MNRVVSYPFYGIQVVSTNGYIVASTSDLINGDRDLTFDVCQRISNDAADCEDVVDPLYIMKVFLYIKSRLFSSERVLKK